MLFILFFVAIDGILIPSFDQLPSEVVLDNDLIVNNDLFVKHDLVVNDVNIIEAILSLVSSQKSLIPPGTIVSFYGIDLPDGWALCDGNNGTPDLRDKFIVSEGQKYSYEESGGSDTYSVSHSGTTDPYALTLDEIPGHSHTQGFIRYYGENGHTAACGDNPLMGGPDSNMNDRCYGNPVLKGSSAVGDDQGHSHEFNVDENLNNVVPPFYALKFIMKLPVE